MITGSILYLLTSGLVMALVWSGLITFKYKETPSDYLDSPQRKFYVGQGQWKVTVLEKSASAALWFVL